MIRLGQSNPQEESKHWVELGYKAVQTLMMAGLRPNLIECYPNQAGGVAHSRLALLLLLAELEN